MDDYRFSVAICVYRKDDATHFREALDSIYNQTLMPDEVVLTVDGPVPDAINTIIETFEREKGMRVFRLATNRGHGEARRECFAHCIYDYVAIADADDVNRSDRFEKQIAAFKSNPKLSAVSSYTPHFVNHVENVISRETLPVTNEEIRKVMKTRCALTQAAAMLKREDVIKAGGYLDWYHAEDYYLWIRMYLCDAEFYNIPEELVFVRTDLNQMQRRGGFKYFSSLKKLYDFMLQKGVIHYGEYLFNVASRFAVQVMMPNSLRSFIRKKLM